jgi:hypothetical protein
MIIYGISKTLNHLHQDLITIQEKELLKYTIVFSIQTKRILNVCLV